MEGKKARRPPRAYKKEYTTAMVGLEEHTFDIGHPKYAVKYERSVDAIARHVQQEYKSGADVALAMRELVAPTVTMPTYPADPNDQEAIQIWKEELREKRTQSLQIEESKKRAYALVMGQCSPNLVSKIRGGSTYVNANSSQDVIELLKLIHAYCCDFGAGQQSTWALEQAKHKVSTYYQCHDTSNTDYIQFFQALVGQPGNHMRHCLDLAVEGVDNFNIDEADTGHMFFGEEKDDCGPNANTSAELQECGFAQRGRSKQTGV